MIPKRAPAISLFVAAGLAATSCASGSSGDETGDTLAPVPAVTEAPNDSTQEPASSDPGVADTDAVDDRVEPPSTEPVATEPTEVVTTEPAEAVTTEAAESAPPATDAAPAPAEIGGRAFAETVQPAAAFDGNPFPDLVVDDVGRDGKANLANVLPSDRPVLLWAWAPH